MFDFNKPVTRENIDLVKYNDKFRFCDKFLNEGRKELLPRLLPDPSAFSYLFFKNDEGGRFKVYPFQDMILNDPHRYIYFRSANQLGKSKTFNLKASRNLVVDHGHSHMEGIISKSLPQSTFQMRRVKDLLNSMKDVNWKEEKSPDDADSMSVISVGIKDGEDVDFVKEDRSQKMKYKNFLVCAPCTEGALGYPFHELNLDEFEYWDIDIQWFYNQIAKPRTFHTRGRILIMTNPNGQENFGAELEGLTGKDGNKLYHTYIFDYLDKPGNTVDGLEEEKLGMTRQQVESTLLAIRSISSKNYFTPDEIERSLWMECNPVLKMVGRQPFFFLDVGAKHDQSVLVGGFVEPDEKDDRFNHIYVPIVHVYPVGYPLNRVVGSEVSEGDKWHYEKSVKDYLIEWGKDGTIPIFGVDVTGNSGISPLFEAVGVFPQDITFSGPVKSGMYQRFKYFMEKGLLHRIKSKEWEYQAAHMEMKKSVRGYLLIHHEREDDLDDCMDATAGLIFLADDPEIVVPSLKII